MIYRRKLGYIAMGGVIATVAIVASNGVTPNLYTAIGGVIAIGAMIAASFAAPKLDSQDDDTCVITCSELNVVNEKGISVVRLGNLAGYGGYVNIMDSSGTSVAGLAGSRFGGTVTVGKEENAVVTLSTDEHGGTIVVNNNDGQPIVRMGAVDANGSVGNLAVAGNTGGPAVVVSADEHGGVVGVCDNTENVRIKLGTERYGGAIIVTNEMRRIAASMSVDKAGGRIIVCDSVGDERVSLP